MERGELLRLRATGRAPVTRALGRFTEPRRPDEIEAIIARGPINNNSYARRSC
jgi:hypothetical protein